MKYADAPEKFLDSEVDLDEQVKSLLQVRAQGGSGCSECVLSDHMALIGGHRGEVAAMNACSLTTWPSSKGTCLNEQVEGLLQERRVGGAGGHRTPKRHAYTQDSTRGNALTAACPVQAALSADTPVLSVWTAPPSAAGCPATCCAPFDEGQGHVFLAGIVRRWRAPQTCIPCWWS